MLMPSSVIRKIDAEMFTRSYLMIGSLFIKSGGWRDLFVFLERSKASDLAGLNFTNQLSAQTCIFF